MKWPKCYCETLTDDIRVEKMIGDDRSMLREERERERKPFSSLQPGTNDLSRAPAGIQHETGRAIIFL